MFIEEDFVIHILYVSCMIYVFLYVFRAVMLFVVKETNHDIFDQRAIEFKIRELSPETKIVRRTLTDLIDQVQLGPNRELIV